MSSGVLIGPSHSVAGFDCDRRWRKAGARDCHVVCRSRRGRRGRGRASAAAGLRLHLYVWLEIITGRIPPLVMMELAVVIVATCLVKDPAPHLHGIERTGLKVAAFRTHRMHGIRVRVDPFHEIALLNLHIMPVVCTRSDVNATTL